MRIGGERGNGDYRSARRPQAEKNIKRAFLLLLGVLLFFTFFSNTLQSLTLPKVTTVTPQSKSLEFTLEGSGVLRPVNEVKLQNGSGWKPREVLVQEGERVKKGQRLIVYDSQSAEAGLQDEIALLDQQKTQQQTLQDQFIQTYAEGDELQIRKARREIEAGKQEQARQARKIAGMRERLTAEQQLKAPFDGIVTRLNALPGIPSSGEPDLVLSSSREGFQFDFTADAGLLTSLGITLGRSLRWRFILLRDHRPGYCRERLQRSRALRRVPEVRPVRIPAGRRTSHRRRSSL